MSESKSQFRAERLDLPPNKKLSRRGFLRLAGLATAAVGTAGAYHSGKRMLEELGYDFWEASSGPTQGFFDEESVRISQATQASSGQSRQEAGEELPSSRETPTTPEAPNHWKFGKIDFANSSEQIGMLYVMGEDRIVVPHFTPLMWYPGVETDGNFYPNTNTGVTYLDEGNRKISNLHSGRHGRHTYTMWGLQTFIEERVVSVHPETGDEVKIRRLHQEVNDFLKEKIIGSEVILQQGSVGELARVVAAVRIPPARVLEFRHHVMDVVPWVAENFPGYGFEQVAARSDIQIDKFCGRNLTKTTSLEEPVPNLSEYLQARFLIAKELV